MAVGSGSKDSALEELSGILRCLIGGTRVSLLGGDKDGPNGPPEHGGESCGKVVGGMVVRAVAAGSGFVTPGSTTLLSMGELVSRQNSLSCRASVPMIDRSIFVRGPPFPERGLEGRECGCSWWEWQAGVSCFRVWLRGASRGPLEWLSRKVGSKTEPFFE